MICPQCGRDNHTAAQNCLECGHDLADGLTVGALLASRYEIQSLLGRGGMGAVYKAHDRVLDELVAIKLLRADLVGAPEMARRFLLEIKLARRVRHPNVCGIHEYGEDGRRRFLSMELIDGRDFKQILRERGPLPPAEAFDLAIQAAEGLQAIHSVGIIHRDLKTSNIMKDARGVVRLMDFGIAKLSEAAEGATGMTATGRIIGTPEYMSPEQARGLKVDFRSDVYALGIVVYELFTGRVPFRGETPISTILKHIQDPVPLEGLEAARIPASLVPVLAQALAKDPEERYASPREFGNAMRDASQKVLGVLGYLHPTPILTATAPQPTVGFFPTSVPTETPVPTPTPVMVRARTPAPRQPVRESPPPREHTETESQAPVVSSPSPSGTGGGRAQMPRHSARVRIVGVMVACLALGGGITGWLLVRDRAGQGTIGAESATVSRASVLPPAAAVPSPERRSPLLAPEATPTPAPSPHVRAAEAPIPSSRPSPPRRVDPSPLSVVPAPAMIASSDEAPPGTPLPASPAAMPAEAPPSGAPPPEPTPGLLQFKVRPWAEVTIDGVKRGTTPPLRPLVLDAGEHVVRLEHPDYKPVQRKVRVVAGQTAKLELDWRLDGVPR